MTPDQLKIIFLVSLAATGFLAFIMFGPGPGISGLLQMLAGTFFLGAVLLTAGTFFSLLFDIDPAPLIRESAYQLSFQQLVSYEDAIPPNLEDNLAVTKIMREDTDGDGVNEWVVFYHFDLDQEKENNPILGAIYDSDRGNPPVIFPYGLRPPSRDYLSEDRLAISLELEQVTTDQNGPAPERRDLPELLIHGSNQLAIFRFKENSEIWDFPRDVPPRYEPIGFFRGTGGVTFDAETRRVTVIDRNGFERGQLGVRSIYEIQATNDFWDRERLGEDGDVVLAAPEVTTVDFFAGPPDDILDTAFPEKTVLAFYASTCGGANEALCANAGAGWEPGTFLASDSDSLAEFNASNPDYFGLPGPGFGNTPDISVSRLCYYPVLETPGRKVVTGEQPKSNVVDIEFTVTGALVQIRRFEMLFEGGKWKILQRLEVDEPCLNAPVQLSALPSDN